MSKSNQFYNRDMFNLVQVTFDESSTNSYTYVSHVKYKLKKGDYVVVPTGSDEDMFINQHACHSTRVVQVTKVISDMSQMSDQFELKHIIQKVNPDSYNKILNAKRKYN